MALPFADFDVWLMQPVAGQLGVLVISSAGVARDQLEIDLDGAEFKKRQSAACSAGPALELRKRFGNELFRGLFTPIVAKLWDDIQGRIKGGQFAGVQMRLWFEEANAAITPWELLHNGIRLDVAGDGSGFLAIQPQVSLTRFLPGAEATFLPTHEKINVLSVAWNPQAAAFANLTATMLTSMRTKIASDPKIDLLRQLTDIPLSQLGTALNDVHVAHVLAHGLEGTIVLADETGKPQAVTQTDFALAFQQRSSLRLVILASCHSGQVTTGGLFHAIATQLIQAGVPAVIAMQYPAVNFETTAEFTAILFAELAKGVALDAAVNAGRLALATTSPQVSDALHQREWSEPVLYLGSRTAQLLNLQRTDLLAADWQRLKDAAATAAADRQAFDRLKLTFEQLAGEFNEMRSSADKLEALRQAAAQLATAFTTARVVANANAMLDQDQWNATVFAWDHWWSQHQPVISSVQAMLGTLPECEKLAAAVKEVQRCIKITSVGQLPKALVALPVPLQALIAALERGSVEKNKQLQDKLQRTLGSLSG